MNVARVVIVGGGLAGMSAAESLSTIHPETQITILESKRVLGGRAGSYDDPQFDSTVDYCQHVAMGCCTNLIDLLTRCGLDQHFRRYRELCFLHPDHSPSRFAPNRLLPAPLHLVGTINALRYLSRTQKRQVKRGLWRLMRTPASSIVDVRASDWLRQARQDDQTIRDFWDVILVSALGEQTNQVSMAAARKVLIDGFAIAHGASDVMVPTLPLANLFGRMLADVLMQRGVRILVGHGVRQIRSDASVVTSENRFESDYVISAVPWYQTARLFDQWCEDERRRLPCFDAFAAFPTSPISGLHLWFDSEITDLDHAVMVGTTAQWLFRDPCNRRVRSGPSTASSQTVQSHYYQVVISASADVKSKPEAQLVETVLAELRRAFPLARQTRLLRHRMVTDPKSVFSILPEVETIRPAAETEVPWLVLAGDWTKTDWPATMEGAVISGRLAAKAISRHIRRNAQKQPFPDESFVCPGLPPGRLARWMIRHG
ncbi:MAG: hydroxysqualene dehydroxylase HpnE [Planctomycetales bacterium]|nr:hydroxysqualene dehydroxylase HpnE [Planctomycetales bacterium]